MNPTPKNKALLPLLALFMGVVLTHAQTVSLPLRQDIQGYRGNVVTSVPLALLPSDTLLTLSVKGYYSATNKTLVTPQPVVVRIGLNAIVQYPSSASLPSESYYELSAGTQVKFYGYVTVSKVGIVQAGISNTVLAGLNQHLGVLDARVNALSTTVGTPFRKSDADALYQPLGYLPTWSQVRDKPSFFSGNYTDLTNRPVLFSGSYTDLTNKPTIPSSASQVGAYTTGQVDNLLAPKLAFQPVASFTLAKAAITPGTPAQFRIASNELFGAPTNSTYDGTNWYHSPALLQNN